MTPHGWRDLLRVEVVVPLGRPADGEAGDVLVEVLLPGRLVAVARGADVVQPRL